MVQKCLKSMPWTAVLVGVLSTSGMPPPLARGSNFRRRARINSGPAATSWSQLSPIATPCTTSAQGASWPGSSAMPSITLAMQAVPTSACCSSSRR